MRMLNELPFSKIYLIVFALVCFPAMADDSFTNDLDSTINYIVSRANENIKFSISLSPIDPGGVRTFSYVYSMAHKPLDPAIELTVNSETTVIGDTICVFATNISTTRIEFRKIDAETINFSQDTNSPGAWNVSGKTHGDEKLKSNVGGISKSYSPSHPSSLDLLVKKTNYIDNLPGFSFRVTDEQKAKRMVNALKHATKLAGGSISKPDPFDDPK